MRENFDSLKVNDNPSIISMVEAFLLATYPASWIPKIIHFELGFPVDDNPSYETVKKSCQNLLKKGKIKRPPGTRRGFYMGIPTPENICGLEDPPVEIHNIKLKVELDLNIIKQLKGKKDSVPPIHLYTQREKIELGTTAKFSHPNAKEPSWFQLEEYWNCDNFPYKVTFQFYEKCILIHVLASKKPIKEEWYSILLEWLKGVLVAYGVNMNLIQMKPVWFEMSKDFTKITIAPNMKVLDKLETKSLLRIYRKTRNLTRLEIGTTWDGEKEILDMFLNFGKPQAQRRTVSEPGDMFR